MGINPSLISIDTRLTVTERVLNDPSNHSRIMHKHPPIHVEYSPQHPQNHREEVQAPCVSNFPKVNYHMTRREAVPLHRLGQ